MPTEYISHGFTLSPGQIKSLMTGKRIRITKDKLQGPIQVLLTKTQINKISKSSASGVGLDLQFSQVQLRKNKVLGQGLLDSLKSLAGDVAQMGLDKGANALKDKLLPYIVDKANNGLKGKIKKMSGKGQEGGGWGEDFGKSLAEGVRDVGLSSLHARLSGRGVGVKKGGRPRKGKGVVLPGSTGNGVISLGPLGGISW